MSRGVACARALLFTTALVWGPIAGAQQAVPPLSAHVTDLTATLNAQQQADLERQLSDFEARKGSQIAVLIVPTTAPESIEQYSLRVAERWKLGRKKADDGAILVVAKDDQAIRIEVGYGLEGALNDANCERIIRDTIAPKFRERDYADGIAAGMALILGAADGEAPPAVPSGSQASGGLGRLLSIAVVLVLVLGALLRAIFGRVGGAFITGGVAGLAAWGLAGAALTVALLTAFVVLIVSLFGGLGLLAIAGSGFAGGGRRDGFSGGGGGFGGGGASGRW